MPQKPKPKSKAKPQAKKSSKKPVTPSKKIAGASPNRFNQVWTSIFVPHRHVATWSLVVLVTGLGLVWQIGQMRPPINVYFGPQPIPAVGIKLHVELNQLLVNAQALVDQGNAHELSVVDQSTLRQDAQVARIDLGAHRWSDARSDLAKLSRDLTAWRLRLDQLTSSLQFSASLTINHPPDGNFIPILLYHNTPPDFEQQLIYLRDHGYQTVTMDQVADALAGRTVLPLKPIAISFDDGYSDQMSAFKLLKKYQMKAIFYIIITRANSGCGTATSHCDPEYLSWGQIKTLDTSGLVTIGDHTFDHPELSKLDEVQQQDEIISAKNELEARLGHAIVHFCYPYGEYNDTTLSLLRQDGFRTATTTAPGFYQSPLNPLLLNRIRRAYILP